GAGPSRGARCRRPAPPQAQTAGGWRRIGRRDVPARIFVLAGVNGAGKSSIGGAALLAHNAPYFNPDLAARTLLDANPGMAQDTANAKAWELGRRGLERALS